MLVNCSPTPPSYYYSHFLHFYRVPVPIHITEQTFSSDEDNLEWTFNHHSSSPQTILNNQTHSKPPIDFYTSFAALSFTLTHTRFTIPFHHSLSLLRWFIGPDGGRSVGGGRGRGGQNLKRLNFIRTSHTAHNCAL